MYNFYTTKKKATVLDALPLNISPKPIFMALLQNFKEQAKHLQQNPSCSVNVDKSNSFKGHLTVLH
ncbi:hypothetical protein COK34_07090 [Bacillus thuringiensis]|nr:hypothetical protein CON56_18515 [Bacillus thuringiensis]PEG02556.1 hypothetical protein CON54_22985 [Bacillus cereus]PEV06061.1 hypothetical protein CN417_19740 [Bacillus thuringiensis]PFH98209.1 hypothetical protein COI64_28305 [Bacillus cereus]PFO46517.1 hypothetical protein COJ84_01225 [Bacillus thuringiensis]